MTRTPETIEARTHTAGGALRPHKEWGAGTHHVDDYDCRGWCGERVYTRDAACEVGPRAAIMHRSCCPVCTP